jgi:hypothetical protein
MREGFRCYRRTAGPQPTICSVSARRREQRVQRRSGVRRGRPVGPCAEIRPPVQDLRRGMTIHSSKPRGDAEEPHAGDPGSRNRAPETLAEKIDRYRKLDSGTPGGAPHPGFRVVRHPRDD